MAAKRDRTVHPGYLDFSVQAAFGIEFGTPMERLQTLPSPNPDGFSFRVRAPEPNVEFDNYLVFAAPKIGVCKIIGIGRSYNSDGLGMYVRSAFDNMHQKLMVKYGLTCSPICPRS
jgi:hypothetical protein